MGLDDLRTTSMKCNPCPLFNLAVDLEDSRNVARELPRDVALGWGNSPPLVKCASGGERRTNDDGLGSGRYLAGDGCAVQLASGAVVVVERLVEA